MLCLNTNIYNKKTKGPTLMELFSHRKTPFFTTLPVRCVHHRVTRHSVTIFKLLPHTRQYSTLLQYSVTLGQRGHVEMLGRILCTKCKMHSNHSLTVWYSNIQKTSPSERPFSHFIHYHRLAGKNWTTTKNNLMGENTSTSSFYLYRFGKYVSCGFPTINFCYSLSTLWNALYVSNGPPDSNTHGSYLYQSYRTAIQQILKGTGQKTVSLNRSRMYQTVRQRD